MDAELVYENIKSSQDSSSRRRSGKLMLVHRQIPTFSGCLRCYRKEGNQTAWKMQGETKGAEGNSECLDRLTPEVTGSSDAMCIRNAVKKSKSRPFSPPFASQGVACPVSWIGYGGKCFYVAKEERNWSLSLETCSSFNASLAVIDTQNELDFWVKIFYPFHYWFGLSREVNQVWKWSNGTEFRNHVMAPSETGSKEDDETEPGPTEED
ncbi:C-type lectin domain family 2 member D, partial [Ophiophagus hannah]